jgi:hypothetical protein
MAGMASPLPTSWEEVLRLRDTPYLRLQTISFFLFGLLLCAGAVQLLWNYLQQDFPRLPRLSYPKALAGITLWGLLFVIVLAMISGARELMTPGAWKRQGISYRLAEDPPRPAESDPAVLRRQHLERLRTVLWEFAATHSGKFPTEQEASQILGELWQVPETGGMRYFYKAGLHAGDPKAVLVYAPELGPGQRMTLHTDGTIAIRRSSDLPTSAEKGAEP